MNNNVLTLFTAVFLGTLAALFVWSLVVKQQVSEDEASNPVLSLLGLGGPSSSSS